MVDLDDWSLGAELLLEQGWRCEDFDFNRRRAFVVGVVRPLFDFEQLVQASEESSGGFGATLRNDKVDISCLVKCFMQRY